MTHRSLNFGTSTTVFVPQAHPHIFFSRLSGFIIARSNVTISTSITPKVLVWYWSSTGVVTYLKTKYLLRKDILCLEVPLVKHILVYQF